MDKETMEELAKTDSVIKDALDAVDLFFSDESLSRAYWEREKQIREYEDELARCRELGLKEGIYKAREEDALNMLRDNMPWAQISKYTSVSAARIAELATMV